MSNEPNVQSEGGIENVNTNPATHDTVPLFTLIPYKGQTAAKAAALVPKEVG
jgi:hypothetical protein